MEAKDRVVYIVREMEVSVRKKLRIIAAENDCKMNEAVKIAVDSYFKLKEVTPK